MHSLFVLRLLPFVCTTLICWGLSSAQALETITTDPTGGGQSHANQQPGLGINYIIATRGTFPSRNSGLGDISPLGADPFLGEITMFAGNYAPRGWAFTDGQLLQVSQNQALFALLSNNYGGNGRTDFKLPDLRGRAAMHAGNGPGLTPLSLGEQLGDERVTLAEAQMPSHNHALNPPHVAVAETTFTGGGGAHSNMMPALGINYQIALQGLFPSRSSELGDIEQNSEIPFIGGVEMFAGSFNRRGTLLTNGQLLPIAQNTALFSLLGITYGGDGRTNFALPDLRGRVVMHEGTGPELTHRSLGEKGGTEEVTLSLNEMPSHTHTADHTLDPTGGGGEHTNVQPFNTLNYIIAIDGVFPSRNSELGDIVRNDDNPFLGEIQLFAGTFAPRGWAFADGQLLSVDQNNALFSLLTDTYGGDGRTTFALPDLRSRVPIHVGGRSGNGPGLRTWNLGEQFGQENVMLTESELPSHTHEYTTPEPGTLALGITSLLGLVVGSRRRSG